MSRAAVVIGLVLFTCGGCAKSYRFDLEVTVTDEADGSPIVGVTLHRNMWGEKTDPKTAETVLLTDDSGRASESFTVTDAAFSAGKPMWLLRVFKEGYESQIIEFKPRAAPVDSQTRQEIAVRLRRGKG
jgi:hypothetical protein